MSMARAIRRGYPIVAYVGSNGHGKTLAMVYDTLPSLDAGRKVISTVALYDEHGNLHPCYERLESLEQIMDAERCDLLLDEVTGVASSRGSNNLPVALANRLGQLRKQDVVVRWTAPAWMRAEVIVRETTQLVVLCRAFFPTKAEDEDGARMWRQARLFAWKAYDAMEFEDFNLSKSERLKPKARQLLWRPGASGRRAESAYDTYEAVSTIGAIAESGSCMTCGGNRPRPKCRCTDDAGSEPAARTRQQPRARPGAAEATGNGAPDGTGPNRQAEPVALHNVHGHVAASA